MEYFSFDVYNEAANLQTMANGSMYVRDIIPSGFSQTRSAETERISATARSAAFI